MSIFFKGQKSIADLRQEQSRQQDIIMNYDALTGLPNWEGMKRFFGALSDQPGYAYVTICSENFNQIHNLFGHKAADFDAIAVAEVISSEISEREAACRETLNHFGILMQVENEQKLIRRIEKIMEKLYAINVTDGVSKYNYPPFFTCGIYEFTGIEESAEDIRDMAALALKESRRKRLPYALYSKEMEGENELLKRLLADAANAMQRQEFVPFFQPKYDMTTGRIVGADVLARWQHPQEGLVMPGKFIPILEQNGTIMELDMYMLEQACKLIQKWTENGQMPVPISVNISPLNIYKSDFTDRITSITEKYHTPPCLIELELNEAIIFENSRFLMNHMVVLSEMGFQLAVDNFGSSYTSLKLLKDMPINLIKLDRDFLKGEDIEGERNKIVLDNIVHMAHELGMLIISGGIENREHVRLLKKINCNFGMGFLFSRPMPLSQFENLTL